MSDTSENKREYSYVWLVDEQADAKRHHIPKEEKREHCQIELFRNLELPIDQFGDGCLLKELLVSEVTLTLQIFSQGDISNVVEVSWVNFLFHNVF